MNISMEIFFITNDLTNLLSRIVLTKKQQEFPHLLASAASVGGGVCHKSDYNYIIKKKFEMSYIKRSQL